MYTRDQLVVMVEDAANRKIASLSMVAGAITRTTKAKQAVLDCEARALKLDEFVNMKPNNEATRAAWIREHFPAQVKELDEAKMAEDDIRLGNAAIDVKLEEVSLIVRLYTVYQPIAINP